MLNMLPAMETEIVKEERGTFTVAVAEPVPAIVPVAAAVALTSYVAAAVPTGMVLPSVAEPTAPGASVSEFAEKTVGQPDGVADVRENVLEPQAAVSLFVTDTAYVTLSPG